MLDEKHRKATMEHLQVLKTLTTNVRTLKENNRYLREKDQNVNDLLKQVVDYFNFVN